MKIAIAYVYPTVQSHKYWPLAERFVQTWQQFPPGSITAQLHIYANGRSLSSMEQRLFSSLNPTVHVRDNSGWDIGAFQQAADTISCDLLVCFGSPVHFWRAGWLDRMVEAYCLNGPGLYGCACYLAPNWHVRTTAFWFPQQILQTYPQVITSNRESRYGFEHGQNSFTRHALQFGFPCIMVTWQGCFPFADWEQHAPTVNEILCRDQHIHL